MSEKTNLTYIEPHRVIIKKNITLLIFMYFDVSFVLLRGLRIERKEKIKIYILEVLTERQAKGTDLVFQNKKD